MNKPTIVVELLKRNTEAEELIKEFMVENAKLTKEREELKSKLETSLDENNSLKLDYSHSESERVKAEAKCAEMLQYLESLQRSADTGYVYIDLDRFRSTDGKGILDKIAVYEKALNELARLGNGQLLGNSVGNRIAQKSLSKTKDAK